MRVSSIFLVLFSLPMLSLQGQSTNVDCSSAFEILDPSDYCSGEDEFDNSNVGDSGFPVPTCWDASENDLWFTFVASHTAVEVIVNGENSTLNNPEISLLKGEQCGAIVDIGACKVNSSSFEITDLFVSELLVGERYYIRVDGERNVNEGKFQLCVKGFNPPVEPQQDCSSAAILCDKSPFVVQSVEGDGDDADEAAGSCLSSGQVADSENNSSWFKWTCGTAGTLTFDILALTQEDDYDFALYELIGDINSCFKTLIRCSAADGLEAPCSPPTGLNSTSTDTEEEAGCEDGQDGYLAEVILVEGRSYALLINQYSNSQIGFSVEFGGTSEFEGPSADFALDYNTCGTTVGVEDASLMSSSDIASYEWEFGSEAIPPSANGPGPFSVDFGSFGVKNITLKVITDQGCQVFVSKEIDLQPCSYIDSLQIELDSIRNIECSAAAVGYIAVIPSNSCGNYEYNIDGGAFQTEPIFDNLASGDHIIGLRDENGCTKDTIFTISQTADFSVYAGDDVTITDINVGADLLATYTGLGDVTISWSPIDGLTCPDGSTTCAQPNIKITQPQVYTITVTDENGCVQTDSVLVSVDLCGASDFVLDPGDDITVDFPGDTVQLNVGMQGSENITVLWTPSEPLVCLDATDNCLDPRIVVMETTTFTITVVDESGCERSEMLTIVVPDVCVEGMLSLQVDSIRGDYCSGALGSYLEVSGVNGYPGYEFSLNDGIFEQGNVFTDLAPGEYKIDIRDVFNCTESTMITIDEIPGFMADAGPNITIDGTEPFDMLSGSHGAAGSVTISWSPADEILCPDGSTNCLNPSVNPFVSTTYTIAVTDAEGCVATDQVAVRVEERSGIYAPNVFSPNGDGVNDVFVILTDPNLIEGIEQLSIFDRWGNSVYVARDLSPNDPNVGWDGSMNRNGAAAGVYVWFAEVKVISNIAGEEETTKTVQGDITLIR